MATGYVAIRGHHQELLAQSPAVSSVPIQLHGTEAPVVVVRVQGQELPLQLDVGAPLGLIIHPDVLATLRSAPTEEVFRGISMDGEIETPIVRMDLVEIGDQKLVDVSARADVTMKNS